MKSNQGNMVHVLVHTSTMLTVHGKLTCRQQNTSLIFIDLPVYLNSYTPVNSTVILLALIGTWVYINYNYVYKIIVTQFDYTVYSEIKVHQRMSP